MTKRKKKLQKNSKMPFLLTVIRTNSPIYLFLKLIKMLHETLDARFIHMMGNLKRKNFYRRNQSCNFLRSSFGTRDNAKALIQEKGQY